MWEDGLVCVWGCNVTMPVLKSLDAFYPGLQVMWEDGLGCVCGVGGGGMLPCLC